jgi:glyoxylase-like metal-dependent hydrolase (beta-lactamase superfamily II)
MEVVPGVHRIPRINGNCYLLVDHELTLIDTGLPHNVEKIMSYVTGILHRKPGDLTTIILTHYHIDHTGNAVDLRLRTGAKIAAHTADADYIEGKKSMPPSKSVLFRMASSFVHVRPFHVDIRLTDGSTLAGTTVIHTPGHTPGSIVVMGPTSSVLFCGDTLRSPNGVLEGPSEKFSLDYPQAIKSVQKISALNFDVLLSGHGDPVRPHASDTVRQQFPR